MRILALAVILVASGCARPVPLVVDCNLPERCDEVVAQANKLLPDGAERISVNAGRGPMGVFHAEVHACYTDGRYLLVDVMGREQGTLAATIRGDGWPDPPCR